MKKILKITAVLLNLGILIFALVISIKEGFATLNNIDSIFLAFFFYLLPPINIFALLIGRKAIKLKIVLKTIAILLNLSFFLFFLITEMVIEPSFLLKSPETIALCVFLIVNIFAIIQDKKFAENDKPNSFFKRIKHILEPSPKKIMIVLFIMIIGTSFPQIYCFMRGGDYGIFGLSDRAFCNLKYSDGGKECLDSSECEGECLTRAYLREPTPEFVVGTCQPHHHIFGCYSHVTNGKPTFSICVD